MVTGVSRKNAKYLNVNLSSTRVRSRGYLHVNLQLDQATTDGRGGVRLAVFFRNYTQSTTLSLTVMGVIFYLIIRGKITLIRLQGCSPRGRWHDTQRRPTARHEVHLTCDDVHQHVAQAPASLLTACAAPVARVTTRSSARRDLRGSAPNDTMTTKVHTPSNTHT